MSLFSLEPSKEELEKKQQELEEYLDTVREKYRKEPLKIIELFGGIGACSKSLEKLNINHCIVDYVEIDEYAVKSFNAVHNTNFEPQDITKWDKNIDVDLIMHRKSMPRLQHSWTSKRWRRGFWNKVKFDV